MTVAVLSVGIAGCGTGPQAQGVSASTASVGSGEYPNLNIPLRPAAPQITPEQRSARTAELTATRTGLVARASAAPFASRAGELRQIGSTHAGSAIRRIEGE